MSREDKIDELQSAIDYLDSAISELDSVSQTKIKGKWIKKVGEIEDTLEEIKEDMNAELAELEDE